MTGLVGLRNCEKNTEIGRMSRFYKQVDFPKIPKHLIRDTIVDVRHAPDIGYGLTHIRDGKELNACSYTYGKIAHIPLIMWIKQNLKNAPLDRLSIKTSDGGDSHIIHSDVNRIYHLNYWWDLGGDQVTTSWYQEKGKPLKRPRSNVGEQSDSGFVDYANVERLESVVFESETWYLFRSDVLHDVINLTGKRQGLAISFSNDEELNKMNLTLHVD